MNAIARQEPGSKLKGSFTDCTLPGKPFIWLPFAGGISAFAVILPKPMVTGHGVGGGYPDTSHVNGCYAETLARSKSCPEFRFLMIDPGLPAMDIIFKEPEAVSPDLQKWAPHYDLFATKHTRI
jgi:hypothetical protein